MTTVTPIDAIDGAFLVKPTIHGDERGIFLETYRREWFPGRPEMVPSKRGDRQAGTVVGLHYHRFQADYWYVPYGTVRVVLFDIRDGSLTEGQCWTSDLGVQPDGSHRHDGVYIPPGVGHGFAALSDCTVSYQVDQYYNPDDELGVAWNDPGVTVDWGVTTPILSARDQANPLAVNLSDELRPRAVVTPDPNH